MSMPAPEGGPYRPEPDYSERVPSEDVLDQGPAVLEEADEPSFTGDTGTTNVEEVVEDGETYFPPIDPVVEPVRPSAANVEGMEVRGGFASDRLENPQEASREPTRMKFNDDEIAENVENALRNDAYTNDLDIEIEVVDGVVYLRGRVNSIEDVEQAEEVAGSVEGVVDVEDELEVI